MPFRIAHLRAHPDVAQEHIGACTDILGTIIELGRALDFTMSTERVEPVEYYRGVLATYCTFGQDYLFSPSDLEE